MFEFYKIKNPDKDEFSSGVRNGRIQFSKRGKSWDTLGALKNHLNAAKKFDEETFNSFYINWLIIKITENSVETLDTVKSFMQ